MKNNDKLVWLFLETYVYIEIEKKAAMLYNTLNGKMLVYESDHEAYSLIRKLDRSNDLLVTKLDLNKSSQLVIDFVKKLREGYFGDYIYLNESKGKPVQYKKVISDQMGRYVVDGSGSNLLTKMYKLNIYINSECSHNCKICGYAFKQIKHCKKSENNVEIDCDKLAEYLTPLKDSGVKINILGGNILNYSKINILLNTLDFLHLRRVLYLNILNVDVKKIIEVLGKKEVFNILLDLSLDGKFNYDKKIKQIIESGMNVIFNLIVKNKKEMKLAENIIEINKIHNYILAPIYHRNIDFFEENILLSKKDIKNINLSYKDIGVKSVLNIYKFGELTIDNDSKVYSNLNSKEIGSINDSLQSNIYFELGKGKNWLETRNKYQPCKKCIYKNLCPPITNYEKFMGRINICKGKGVV